MELILEFIPCTRDGQDIFRIRGVFFYLISEMLDVDIYYTTPLIQVGIFPYMVAKKMAAQDFSSV